MTEIITGNKLNELKSFLQRYRAIQVTAMRAQAKIEEACAPRFSAMNYIDCRETKISAIIGDFLHPKGTHGQGTIFLHNFIEMLNTQIASPGEQLEIDALDETKVWLEAVTGSIKNHQRRIDILLENPRWALALENKPWAWEQKDQLADYQQHLDNKFSHIPCRYVVFLSGTCQPSDSHRDKAPLLFGFKPGDNCGAQHPHLKTWIENSAQICKVDRVRHFLLDFAFWIDSNFTSQAIPEDIQEGDNEQCDN